jgi:hydrogenase maturation factor
MRPGFLEDLEADIEALEEAITRQIESRGSHVESTAAIEDATERGISALRELDPIMRNTFADDPVKLAAWLSASRVERRAPQ